MVGGGRGAFIGEVHRMASRLDGQIELVCGAFSADPEKSKLSGDDFFLDPDRVYSSYQEMFIKESALPEDVRMDFVSIVTPNHLHFDPVIVALESGFHVICDKPIALSLDQAKIIQEKINEHGRLFALTHNYTGYPMVKEAKHMVKSGKLGKIRKCIVEYPQGWLSDRIEATGQKQAAWRTDPNKSGKAGCLGDIGTHAENLLEYITGLKIIAVCADVHTFVEGRALDDDVSVLLKLEAQARGILFASQIANGEENNLKIRIYGEKGGLEWSQMEPNTLIFRQQDQATQLLRTGVGPLSEHSQIHARIPAGHPEGFIEAFANIYRNFAKRILEGKHADNHLYDFPGIEDGIRGMKFIECVLKSAISDKKWIDFY